MIVIKTEETIDILVKEGEAEALKEISKKPTVLKRRLMRFMKGNEEKKG
tara:strand:+ start:408 stop:554 length:147 start_codon:yes stop_codon:yes gene_type:complete